ncbi:MAG TPA: hypothetical protein VNN21_05535, partial [Dehalococcoidia bacterium]|nr:hypothetical protein [Dehalococcoidia bacterium]
MAKQWLAPVALAAASIALACGGRLSPPASGPAAAPATPTATIKAQQAPAPLPRPALVPADPNAPLRQAGEYVLDTRTGSLWTLGPYAQGAWSPDGSDLAFRLCCQGRGFVQVLEVPSGRAAYVETGDVAALAWSPDSRRVAFSVTGPGDEAGVYVLSRDGTG